MFNMDCRDPNCLEFSFSMKNIGVYDFDDLLTKICDLRSSVQFKLKCKDGNVTYEDGKVVLYHPKKLERYKEKVDDKNWFYRLIELVVEYFQKFCEKLGFKFETKIEHDLGEPLEVVSEADISFVSGLKLEVNNPI